jgi:hypothetical protein
MRRHVLDGVRGLLFLLVLAASLYFINEMLMPKYILKNSTWPTTSSYNQFYQMENDSIDVLFFGSSVAVNSFSPQEIYNEYGIRSYNLGSEQQSIFLSYFWLKEALRFQSPQVVVLDTRYLFEIHGDSPVNTTEGLTRKCLDPMRWSEVKREAVSDLCAMDETQSEISYYLKNIRYHARWAELEEYDILRHETRYSGLKGYAPIASYGGDSYAPYEFAGDTEARQQPHEVMQVYLDKTVELCRDAGITLVLVSLPGNPMNDAYNNTLKEYAQDKGIDYCNMCETEIYASIGAVLPRENAIGHANLWGAIKTSRYVGGLLADRYQVAAVWDEQYEATKEYYDHIVKNCELTHITDMGEYLRVISDDGYTVFIAARDDATQGLSDEIKEGLKSLGLQTDLSGKYRWSYAAVISPENGVSESLTETKPASLNGSIRNQYTLYTVTSCGWTAGNTSSINIDGGEYCRNTRGLNFVIYDNSLMKVIDRVTFDTWGECGAAR